MTLSCTDFGIRKIDCVAKTQFIFNFKQVLVKVHNKYKFYDQRRCYFNKIKSSYKIHLVNELEKILLRSKNTPTPHPLSSSVHNIIHK